MYEKNILTDDLLQNITASAGLETLLADYSSTKFTLAEYLNVLLERSGKKKSEVIRASHINETFGYQLFSGARTNPSRNKVLALAFALEADLHDTRLLLSLADAGDVYVKNRRDAIIVYCISNSLNLDRADEELHRFGEDTISETGIH